MVVQFTKNENINKFISDKKYLTSFVGAAKHPGYLSNVRERICDELVQMPLVKIKSRDQWHFQKEVYEKQISINPVENKNLRDMNNENEYKDILKQSIFSLCPSGTGCNTIRLWHNATLIYYTLECLNF